MQKQLPILILLMALLGAQCTSPAADQGTSTQEAEAEIEPDSYEPFESAKVRFEQNATDGDVEVVFEVNGGDEGLTRLKVVSPDGSMLVDFTSHGDESMGIRKFVMESPEPTDKVALKKAFPEGAYKFTGIDTEDNGFKGEATLLHQLPAPANILNPEEEAEDVPVNGLVIRWSPVENVTGYIVEVELEEDELDMSLKATLDSSSQSFAVPDGFLLAGMEYKVAIGTITEVGNASFVERAFITAGEEE